MHSTYNNGQTIIQALNIEQIIFLRAPTPKKRNFRQKYQFLDLYIIS